MTVLTARYGRSAVVGNTICTIQSKDLTWRLEGWQWRRVEWRPSGRAFAELRDPAGALIRRKALDNIEALASSLGSEINVEFLPEDHPSRQSDVMTPARFTIVDRAGVVLFVSDVQQTVMLDPSMVIRVSMTVH